jgi:hypothetical protein
MKGERLFSRPDFIEEEAVRILNRLVQVVLYAPLFRSGMTLEFQKCLTELSAFSGLGLERCDNYERLAGHIDFPTLPEMDSQRTDTSSEPNCAPASLANQLFVKCRRLSFNHSFPCPRLSA